MTDKRKYQRMLIASIVAFIYVACVEVVDRFQGTINLYNELQAKELKILTPEELAQKKADLVLQRAKLIRAMTEGNQSVERNQLGVVKFLNKSAREASVKFQSLTPLEDVSAGQMKTMGFRLDMITQYHRVGSFVNRIESGPLPVQVLKINLEKEKAGSSNLLVTIEGRVHFLTKESLRP